jgi:protein TonB
MSDSYVHDFLARLGLREDEADNRAIRRAYARELKQIDQEHDAPGFQRLRNAYEEALQWNQWRTAQQAADQAGLAAQPDAGGASATIAQASQAYASKGETAPAAMAQPAQADAHEAGAVQHASAYGANADGALRPPGDTERSGYAQERVPVQLAASTAAAEPRAPEQDSPAWLSATVLRDFGAVAATLAGGSQLHDKEAWTAALQRSLDDERLLNITARTMFEARVAALLADGWRPGHETLFVAAMAVFDWVNDKRRLHALGRAGMMLNHAIDERMIFNELPEAERNAQRKVAERLRDPRPPTRTELRHHRFHVERMVTRFPAMMAVIADQQIVRNWLAAFKDMQGPAEEPPEINALVPHYEPKRGGWPVWRIIVGLVFVINLFSHLAKDNKAPEPAHFDPQRLAPPPDTRPPSIKVSQEQLDEIQSRITYHPVKRPPPGSYQVKYDVFLDADGAVLGMNLVQRSGLSDFDEAVAKALRETRTFKPNTETRFQVAYALIVQPPRQGAQSN